MFTLRTHGWRLALIASGILLVLGGRLHPSADAEDSLAEELATMAADDRWIPGHALIAASAVLLAVGLWAAWGSRAWPARVQLPLAFAAAAFTAYVFETIAHLSAGADAADLAAGETAPVAMTHIGLSIVLYPITGWALILLAWSFGRAWRGWRRGVAVVGVVAGVLQTFSVPLSILLPDAELSPVFAGAAMLLAVFSIGTGLVGAPRRSVTTPVPQPAAV
ncbi:hypothetical protein [Nocardioides sp. SR21]|uniref:hypothetical protein n=1 Tax=Nocardioides sp. SR21 TaxID=2919501 RepID=UPI001FAAF341|nr:hypothetical protein [Nocardioides sp. SR21]